MLEDKVLNPVVLILEDDWLFRENMEEALLRFQAPLGPFDFDLVTARSYEEALKVIAQAGSRVVLALLDLEIPRNSQGTLPEQLGYHIAELLPPGCSIYCTSTRREVRLPSQAAGRFEKDQSSLLPRIQKILSQVSEKK